MKVLHLFDRYLNHTMNWAYQLIKNTPEVDSHISSPIYFSNDYLVDHLSFHKSNLQKNLTLGKDEWNIGLGYKSYGRFLKKHHARSTREYAHKNEIDLAHAHFAQVGVENFKLMEDIPVFVSFYGYDYEKLPRKKPELAEKYNSLFQKSAGIIVEGGHGKEVLIDKGCPQDKIHIVHLGQTDFPEWTGPKTKKSDVLNMVQPATFTEKKGQIYSIRALRMAIKRNINCRITFIGEKHDLSYYRSCAAEAADLVDKGYVQFKDFVPYSQFNDFLKLYDVIIQPSCYAADGDCEGGAPISLINAQALGLPAIATKHCDIPEEVLDKKTGLLVDEKNTTALANCMETFASMDSHQFSKMSQNARDHVELNYNLNTSGKQLRSIYKNAL